MYDEFQKYAIKHMGISGMQFHQWDKLQENIYLNSKVVGSMTPYILEERKLQVTQMDIFSRQMMDRILWVCGQVNDMMSTIVSAQLMFLDSVENTDITMHVDSPGGGVKAGLSMVDTMNYINSDVKTVNTGMAASMGSILLGNGTKGKRYSLEHSRVMLHQVSSGAYGHVEDMKISLAESVRANDILFDMLGKFCDKTKEEVLAACNRDNWLDAEAAKKYGIIDGIVKRSKK